MFKELIKLFLRRLGVLVYVSRLHKIAKRYRAVEHPLIQKAFASHDQGDMKPVLIWTSHKSASSLISRLFKFLRRKKLVRYYDYETQLTRYGNVPNFDDLNELLVTKQMILLSEPAAIYGPLRQPYEFSDLTGYRHIIFLRDPRDVAVSAYYWFRDHCGIPDHKFWADTVIKRRNHLRSIGVGEYALEAANDWLIPLYEHLRDLRDSGADALFISYDEFRSDTPKVLNDAVEFSLGSLSIEQRIAVEDFCNGLGAEGASTHRRSGLSGQFYDEMTEEEIDKLNETFVGVLSYWGFTK